MVLLEERQTRGFERVALPCGLDRRILFLEDQDRKMLEFTVQGTMTRRQAAMLLGLSHGTVTRRIHRLMRRLHDPVVVALVEGGKLLPELHQEVGLAYFLRAWPIRRIAREYGLTVYEVKRMITYVRGWHEAMKGR